MTTAACVHVAVAEGAYGLEPTTSGVTGVSRGLRLISSSRVNWITVRV
jgi:hypothetical protein